MFPHTPPLRQWRRFCGSGSLCARPPDCCDRGLSRCGGGTDQADPGSSGRFPRCGAGGDSLPSTAVSALPAILNRAGPLPASLAFAGQSIKPGNVYVAPPNCHMLLENGHIRLTRGPRENGNRPSIDALFRSAAASAGDRVIGVLLSGNLYDGTLGLLRIKQQGGVTVVQDPADAMYAGMPTSAIERVKVDHIVTLKDLPALLVRLAGEPAETAQEDVTMADESDEPAPGSATEREVVDQDRQTQPGVPSTWISTRRGL